MAVVKADAYGHGVHIVAPTCLEHGIQDFGVASVYEGTELRVLLGPEANVYLLSPTLPEEASAILDANLVPLVSDYALPQAISATASARGTVHPVHVEIDTGIGRAGLPYPEASAIYARIASLPGIRIAGISTHFASADDDVADATEQLRLFENFLSEIGPLGADVMVHADNSPATLTQPRYSRFNMIRPGLLLYGIESSEGAFVGSGYRWKPVLSLQAKVTLCRRLPAGATISYGKTFTVPSGGGVYATIPVGYGDGYLRQLSGIGYVVINGQRARICGRVCMDQLVVDVTAIAGVSAGVVATLIGSESAIGAGVGAAELARMIGATPHQITTCLTGRVPRIASDG